jgi:hypothetical protein
LRQRRHERNSSRACDRQDATLHLPYSCIALFHSRCPLSRFNEGGWHSNFAKPGGVDAIDELSRENFSRAPDLFRLFHACPMHGYADGDAPSRGAASDRRGCAAAMV